jgi:hypothetical protein
MKIDVLGFNQPHSCSLLAPQEVSMNISCMHKNIIKNNLLDCYEKDYKAIGGSEMPAEILNMALKRINNPVSITIKESMRITIFNDVSEQIFSFGITNSKEVWRLANIFTNKEYGYHVSYLSWKVHTLLKAIRF